MDLTGPLAQFQATLPEREDVLRLLKSINSTNESPIADIRLTDAIEVWWPRLQHQLNDIMAASTDDIATPTRGPQELMEELLEITRDLQRRILRAELTGFTAEDHHAEDVIKASQEQLAIYDLKALLTQYGLKASNIKVSGKEILVTLNKAPSRNVRLELLEVAHRYGFHFQSRTKRAASH